MSNFNNPVDIAWRAYLAVLKQEGLSREEISIAQQSYKDGWHECERQRAWETPEWMSERPKDESDG